LNSTEITQTSILGTKLSLCDEEQLIHEMDLAISSNSKRLILSGNIYSFNLCYENRWLRDFFNKSDIVRLDGEGLRLGARLLGMETPKRMTWADFAWSLSEIACQKNWSLYFLGGKPGVADQASDRLTAVYPGLKIVGIKDGYFNKSQTSEENAIVLAEINRVKPDILIVGFGMPVQEHWLLENRAQIGANIIITGGAVFDYISGELKRGPGWMTDHGLEWLSRLIIEPGRLWKRYIIGNPLFILRVLKQKFGLIKFDRVD
jgi:N-acetylglucosaminyldiphosphoundecaprenol N-acetyl-beta-D-mannosaminyltransferase